MIIEDEGRRGLATLGLLLGTIVAWLDTSIVNVALPHMQGSLSASSEQITWIVTCYVVASVVAMPLSGWLAARVGAKSLLIASIIAFTLASMLCGVATSLPQMVLFRILQGLAAAPMGPLSQAMLFNINPPSRYGRAMALFSMGTVVAPIVGPVLGGYITDVASWRWCFYINLPAGVIGALLLFVFLPSDRSTPRKFDFLGYGSLAVAIAAFQLMLDRGPSLDWFYGWEVRLEAMVAAGGLWVFLTHTLTTRHPLFDPQIFTDRNFVVTTVFGFFLNLMLFSSLALLPLLMQGVLGYPVLVSGLVSAPRGLVLMAAAFAAGRLDGRVDSRVMIAFSVAMITVAFWRMAQFDLSMGPSTIVVATLFQGLGQGLIMVPLSTLAFVGIAPTLRADAAAATNLMRMLGGSVGVAMMQGLNAVSAPAMHAQLAAHLSPENAVARAGLPHGLWPDTVQGALLLDAEITRQATMVAFLNDFRLMVVVGVVCLPLLLFLRAPKRAAAEASHGLALE
jgi:DHA2 family multidrug resistance protein